MQIDRSRIAIRQRSWSDNLDLALQCIRSHLGGVWSAAAVGVLPAMLLNFWIIRSSTSRLSESADFESMASSILLVMLEAPLVTAPLTLYLGQILFVPHADRRQIARDFVHSLPQLLLFQVVLRAMLIIPVVTWFIPYGLWPYLNEIILLERNPLVSSTSQMSTFKRNSIMHRGVSGDNMARAIGAGLLACLLVTAMYVSCMMLCDLMLGVQIGWVGETLLLQAILWSVAVYFTVARFLTYLDQRIRNEGWELELTFRAQRQRLLRQPA